MAAFETKANIYPDGITLAVIAARGGSKGLPGKNLLEIGGRSLVRRAVDSAIGSGCFDHVICSSDCPEIAANARSGGAEIPFMRPPELSADDSTSMDVIFHAIDRIEAGADGRKVSIVCLCEPTTPLRNADDVRAAFELLLANPQADSVVSVTESAHSHPAWLQKIDTTGKMQRYFPDMPFPTRRQDFDALAKPYMLNGAVYVGRPDAMRCCKSFLCENTLAYIMPPERSVNIDSALDLVVAEAIYKSSFGQ